VVIVYGGVTVDPVRVKEVTAAAKEFEARCRAEPGCVDYVLSWRVDDPTRIMLVEAWASEETSQAHRQREHVREWSAYIAGASVGSPQFSEYRVA
jgi:quinol monooxygenase YgiN